jgi:hypothetical protein
LGAAFFANTPGRLEAVYQQMWEIWRAGRAQASFSNPNAEPLLTYLRADRIGRRREERAMARMAESPLAVYQAHLEKGELAYQWSPDAQKAVFYPRVICPFTGSDRLDWRVSAGLGRSQM